MHLGVFYFAFPRRHLLNGINRDLVNTVRHQKSLVLVDAAPIILCKSHLICFQSPTFTEHFLSHCCCRPCCSIAPHKHFCFCSSSCSLSNANQKIASSRISTKSSTSCARLYHLQMTHVSYLNVTGSFWQATRKMCSRIFVSYSLDIGCVANWKNIPVRHGFADIYQGFGCDSYASIQIERMTVTREKPIKIHINEDVRTKNVMLAEIKNLKSLQLQNDAQIGKPLLYYAHSADWLCRVSNWKMYKFPKYTVKLLTLLLCVTQWQQPISSNLFAVSCI